MQKTVKNKILVVDDVSINRLYAKRILAEKYEVKCVENGSDALKIVNTFHPDLILLDIMMPGINGYEVCEKLKKNNITSSIPIIMLTAVGDVSSLKHAFDAGAMDYITKPFNTKELFLRIKNSLLLTNSVKQLKLWKQEMTKNLQIASFFQQSILPTHSIHTDNFNIHFFYNSCDAIGGDVFDGVVDIGINSYVYIGDVSGHGIGPALASSLIKAFLVNIFKYQPDASPSEICNQLEISFRKYILDPGVYLTFYLMIHYPKENIWKALICGHPDPLVYQDNTEISDKLFKGSGGMPIGLNPFPGNGYMEEDEVIIPCSEDLNFILFTDGITEAIHKKTEELLGRENLKKYTSDFFITKKKENFLEGLLQKIEEENFDTHQDDCSILLVHSINSKNLILSDKIELSFDLIQDMGNRILKSLQKEGWEDKTTFMIELLSIEYLNNIIQHNEKKEIKVHVSLQNYNDFCLLIFVDNAPSWNFNAFYSKSDDDDDSLRSRGRGLSIIKRILSNVEFSRNAGENNCIFKIARNAAEKLREEG